MTLACCGQADLGSEASECRLVGLSVVDGCSAGCVPAGGEWCHVEISVHKVVVERRLKASLLVRWFTGHTPMLFVEVESKHPGAVPCQRTGTGELETDDEPLGNGRTEVWTWSGVRRQVADGQVTGRPSPLKVAAPVVAELQLRVVGNHVGGTLLGESEELLGVVNFRMDDDVRSGTWPLLRGNRICGSVTLEVSVYEIKAEDSERPPECPRAAKAEERWKTEDVRLYDA
eukprot:CAMPEP_0203875768 /NCGR_PEP_ID=MMETSP0359-20131031/20984_1 /ASSEMBLY_ACC=CAM_ASM_000338 /TAXON_ID=268821 /ORGANISM="Scrippsiella Hangoei, Strain SHTV-5" /LENGTH=229 /DNA_ID=CAMNT_0050794579 /DNA_START=37 /DNA_END=726 /DNA_ORIENTATION=-